MLAQFYFRIIDLITTCVLIYIWYLTKQVAYASIQLTILLFAHFTQSLLMPKYLPNNIEVKFYERLIILTGMDRLWFDIKVWKNSAIKDRKPEPDNNDYTICKIWEIV